MISNGFPRFWACFALYLADLAILFFFAHRLFHKKRRSFLAANICGVGGAALFALIDSVFVDFFQLLGIFFNCGITIFVILTLQFIYMDKLFYKTAYTLLYISVFSAADIFLMNLFRSLYLGSGTKIFAIERPEMFVLLYCVMLRVIRLIAAAIISRMLLWLSYADKRDWEILNYTALILFCISQIFGAFSTGIESSAVSLFPFVINAALGAAMLIGITALLRFFPRICKLLRTDELDAKLSFEAAPPTADGLSLRDMQKLRHDVKNNIATISALIDSGDAAEAKRLLDELGARLGSALGGSNKTGIPAADTTVSKKAKRCEELSITLDMHVEPLPETKIPPIDLSSVISNILDNAIEAAQGCENPVITLRIFKYKSYLAMICENPTNTAPRVINGTLASTKDGSGHGYGMEIIGEICKNNNGRFQYEFDNNTFKASAFLEL